MTKKDYIIIANTIGHLYANESKPPTNEYTKYRLGILNVLIDHLSKEFIKDNPRFDIARFKQAIYN